MTTTRAEPTTAGPEGSTGVRELVAQLRGIAVRSLVRMYRPEERLFAFRLRRAGGRDALEGVSRRYTAIVLIGLAGEPDETVRAVLHGQNPQDVCGHLLDGVDKAEDIGEVALTLWAARVLDHPHAAQAVERLKAMRPDTGPWPTVEIAWSLTSLVIGGSEATDRGLADAVARRFLASFEKRSGLFPHRPEGFRWFSLRSHVSCFADLAYPIQALSHCYRAMGDEAALAAARQCANQICALQGPAGQWWWHYDIRTGQVIEGYPVYAVHQDAMAPMALFALRDACGDDHPEAVEKSLAWLVHAPEIGGSLIDTENDVIWRKVARREPNRLTRRAQAIASRLRAELRIPRVDRVLRPVEVDRESRPYHMGWVFHAWSRVKTGAPTMNPAGEPEASPASPRGSSGSSRHAPTVS